MALGSLVDIPVPLVGVGGRARAAPVQHMVNKTYTRWVAANLISGHLVRAGNHRHGTAGHRQGMCSAL